jgi:hypothetical protein
MAAMSTAPDRSGNKKSRVSSRRARERRECRDGGQRKLAVMATFTMVSDSGVLARAQQRGRDGGGRCIALRETKRGEWRGMEAREAREGVVSALYYGMGAVYGGPMSNEIGRCERRSGAALCAGCSGLIGFDGGGFVWSK